MNRRTYEKVMYSVPLFHHPADSNPHCVPLTQRDWAFLGKTKQLRVRFNRKTDTGFFTLAYGEHKVVFSFYGAKRHAEKHEYRRGVLRFADVCGIDYISSGYTNGIRGRAIFRDNRDGVIKFAVKTIHLIGRLTPQNTIEFVSRKTQKVVFCLSAPYLEDGGGNLSTQVTYDLQSVDSSTTILSVHGNSQWCKESNRILPVSVPWQITVPELTNITTYSKIGPDLVETPLHKIGGTPPEENEMILQVKVPPIKKDEMLERAILILTQAEVFSADRNPYSISLFQSDSLLSPHDGVLMDHVPLHDPWSVENQEPSSYCFDITKGLKQRLQTGVSEIFLKIKIERKAKGYENYVVLHGATSDILLAPKMEIICKKITEKSKKNRIQKGDLISLKKNGHYATGGCIPEWMRIQKWYVDQVKNDSVLIHCNELGSRYQLPPVDKKSVVVVKRASNAPLFEEDCE